MGLNQSIKAKGKDLRRAWEKEPCVPCHTRPWRCAGKQAPTFHTGTQIWGNTVRVLVVVDPHTVWTQAHYNTVVSIQKQALFNARRPPTLQILTGRLTAMLTNIFGIEIVLWMIGRDSKLKRHLQWFLPQPPKGFITLFSTFSNFRGLYTFRLLQQITSQASYNLDSSPHTHTHTFDSVATQRSWFSDCHFVSFTNPQVPTSTQTHHTSLKSIAIQK